MNASSHDEPGNELAALRARVAEARALLDRATQFLGAEKGGSEYKLLADIEDWLYPQSAGRLSGNKPAQRTPSQSATDIQLNGCRLHGRQDCKTC